MKLETYSEKKGVKVQPVRLALEQFGNNIDVIAVDEYGMVMYKGHLVRFTFDGKIQRHTDVNENLGFQLTQANKIKESLT